MRLRFLIAVILSLSVQVWAMGDTYIGRNSEFGYMVSIGQHHTCALDAEGVKCWGLNHVGQAEVPALESPTQVSVGLEHTCAVDTEDVKCWGLNNGGQTNVPALKKPTQVTAGEYHTCALDAEGVKCWGDNFFGQANVPALKKPTQVTAGQYHTCALDSEGVKCWGRNDFAQTNVPALKSPIQVSAGAYHACALDSEGVKCWGWNKEGQTNVPALKSPTQVTAGQYHTCALDAEGVKCWGPQNNYFGQTNVPALNSPIQVHAGFYHTCALDSEGVKCWGLNNFGQTNVPPMLFDSDLIDETFSFVTSARADYLKGVAKLKVDVKSKTYYLKCLLVAPTILSVDSSYFVETFIPKFKKEVERLQNKFSNTGDIREISDTEGHRMLAIMSIQSALSVSLSFISQAQQTSLQESIRAAGVALAEPMNNQKVNDLISKLDSLSSEKQKLKSSSKSAFLVETLELAANWLREKVK